MISILLCLEWKKKNSMYKLCTFCGSIQHDTKYCPHTWNGQINRARLLCAYCGSDKHTSTYCPKVWGGNANRRNNPNGDYVD